MSKIKNKCNETKRKLEKFVYTFFLSLWYILSLILGKEYNNFSVFIILSTISYVIYVLCLIYSIIYKQTQLLLTSAFINAMLHIFSYMIYTVAVYPLNSSFKLQLLVFFIIIILILISYLLGKIIYKKLSLYKKENNNQKVVVGSGIIFAGGLTISFFFRSISRNMTDVQ